MKRIICIVIWAFIVNLSIYAQNPPPELSYDDWKRVVPQEPNIASLFKFNTIPVNEYTGVPRINIPMYTLQEDDMQVPIALAYHSGGIRVGEESSNVGLGWTLQAGGAITRALADRDDLRYSRATLPDPPLTDNGHFLSRTYQFHTPAQDISTGFPVNGVNTTLPLPLSGYWSTIDRLDYIPDVFSFNFGGYTGSFVFTETMEVFSLEATDLKINYIPGSNPFNGKFEAITPDGILYEFAQTVEVTQRTGSGVPHQKYVSTWYLTNISNANRTKNISFVYSTREEVSPIPSYTQNLFLINVSSSLSDPNNSRSTSPLFSNQGVYLERIISPKAQISFGYSDSGERQDIASGYILENISVEETIGTASTVKNFTLQHSYFGNMSDNSIQPHTTSDYSAFINNSITKNHTSHYSLRLRLDALIEDDIKTHTYEYHDMISPPRKTSLSQDHWGYYNGENNSESFIPLYTGDAMEASVPFSDLINANRNPNLSDTKVFTLRKINYPTGGSTEFDHELHTFDNDNPSQILNQEQTVTAQSSTYTNTDGAIIEQPFEVYTPTAIVHLDYRFTLVDWPNKYTAPPNNAGVPYHSPGGPIDAYIQITDEQNNVVSGTHVKYYQHDAYYPHTSAPAQAIHEFDLNLSAGEYTLKVYFYTNDPGILGEAKATLQYQDQVVSGVDGNYLSGGGLRVASITNYDTDGSFISKHAYNYHYQDHNGDTQSHGRIRNSPDYAPFGREKNAFDSKYATASGSVLATVYGIHNTASPENDINEAKYIKRTSNTILYQDQGSYIGYNTVVITAEDEVGQINGKQVYQFEPFQGLPQQHNGGASFNGSGNGFVIGSRYAHRFHRIADPETGLLRVKESYSYSNNEFKLVEKVENNYSINGIAVDNYNYQNFQYNANYVLGGIPFLDTRCDTNLNATGDCFPYTYYWYHLNPYYQNKVLKTATRITNYDLAGNETVAQDVHYYYDSPYHVMLTRTESLNSKGDLVTTSFYYPDDITNQQALTGTDLSANDYAVISSLKSNSPLPRVGILVQRESQVNNSIAIQRRLFKDHLGKIVLSKGLTMYNKGTDPSGYAVQELVSYDIYDNDGNLIQLSQKEEIPITLIWGYNKSYPVAKIENATFSEVASAIGVSEIVLKQHGVHNLSLLANLRQNLPSAMVTTFNYDPLIGITSITDPKGQTAYYEYDDFNRLKQVKDQDGNILSQNEYNYRQD